VVSELGGVSINGSRGLVDSITKTGHVVAGILGNAPLGGDRARAVLPLDLVDGRHRGGHARVDHPTSDLLAEHTV
jgi:hypothetical protein